MPREKLTWLCYISQLSHLAGDQYFSIFLVILPWQNTFATTDITTIIPDQVTVIESHGHPTS